MKLILILIIIVLSIINCRKETSDDKNETESSTTVSEESNPIDNNISEISDDILDNHYGCLDFIVVSEISEFGYLVIKSTRDNLNLDNSEKVFDLKNNENLTVWILEKEEDKSEGPYCSDSSRYDETTKFTATSGEVRVQIVKDLNPEEPIYNRLFYLKISLNNISFNIKEKNEIFIKSYAIDTVQVGATPG